MKIDRLLAIFILLLNRRRMTANDLADQFEVSVRTIYRDIDTLNRSGIPVVSFQGHGGGFCIPDHYKLSRQLLTFSDMTAILGTLKGVNQTLRNRELDRAIEKIESLIPPAESQKYQDGTDGFRVDIRPWGAPDSIQELVGQVHRGIQESRILEFEYCPIHGETRLRRVEPHTLVFKGYAWYLLAYCLLRRDFRVFRLSRMAGLRLTRDHFIRRKIDPAPYFTPEADSRERMDLVLKFEAGHEVRLLETFSRRFLEFRDDGSVLARLSLPDDPWTHSFILGFGDTCEVVSPEALRRKVAEKIDAMKKKYSNLT